MIRQIDEGRINIMRRYMRHTNGLNIGCELQRFPNKWNVDVVKDDRHDADIIGDVCDLDFKSNTFDEIFLFEVLEHIPKDMERVAISEVCRVLVVGGQLLMSVPNKSFFYLLLDAFWWLGIHRHYNKKDIRSFFKGTDLKIQHLFTAGRLPFGALVCFAYIINRWVLRRKKFDWLSERIVKAYDHEMGTDGGGTLFCVAVKE